MPIPGSLNLNGNYSVATYIDYKEDSATSSMTAIISGTTTPAKNLSVSFGAGLINSGKDSGHVIEAKGTYSFNDYMNAQLRIRSSHSPAVDKTQFRLSPGFKVKVADKTTLYANPYVAANVDYRKDKCTLDYGAFAGVTQNLGEKTKLSFEGQKYRDHWGMNIIFSANF